ncbi:hypothetical protein AX774_g5545 [Zancudomyces culisetae]|uniref:Uncharacterized protein n=1 Tax=Zancudomyces culisetae TaxID=1213189 RepID=A0A1R1PJ84_ZANCU|nr:hypothetical protein AX774_g5545 [Zancudomyces culisetae]|eukprot:OMH81008.1 hypothetical protein AX774_g5545 [Zancudomyces culisetae]
MNPKFRKWLLKEKDIYFEDLSSEESKRYFQKFVKKWNRNELKEKYYTGENDTAAAMKKTTRYTWDFAKKLDDRTLESVVKKVSEITNETRRSDPVPLSVSSNNIKVNGDSSGGM